MLCVFELNEHDIETPLYFFLSERVCRTRWCCLYIGRFPSCYHPRFHAAVNTFTTSHACFSHASQGLSKQDSPRLHSHRKVSRMPLECRQRPLPLQVQRLASFRENEKNVGLDEGPGHGLQTSRREGRRQRNSVTIGPITRGSI